LFDPDSDPDFDLDDSSINQFLFEQC